MKHIIVVCGTYHEWLNFRDTMCRKKRITNFKISGNSFTVDEETTYHSTLANDCTKIMGFSKYTTSVIRIGTWYESITADVEKYLALFQGR